MDTAAAADKYALKYAYTARMTARRRLPIWLPTNTRKHIPTHADTRVLGYRYARFEARAHDPWNEVCALQCDSFAARNLALAPARGCAELRRHDDKHIAVQRNVQIIGRNAGNIGCDFDHIIGLCQINCGVQAFAKSQTGQRAGNRRIATKAVKKLLHLLLQLFKEGLRFGSL